MIGLLFFHKILNVLRLVVRLLSHLPSKLTLLASPELVHLLVVLRHSHFRVFDLVVWIVCMSTMVFMELVILFFIIPDFPLYIMLLRGAVPLHVLLTKWGNPEFLLQELRLGILRNSGVS